MRIWAHSYVCMGKTRYLCNMKSILILALAMLSFHEVDEKLVYEGAYSRCMEMLEEMLPKAESPRDRAGVLCRLSEVSLLLGEKEKDNAARQEWFSRGLSYADQAIKADPSGPDGYMWHCANKGRDCMTRKLNDQIAAVPVMTGDLATILEKLGRTDYSSAWHALAEIYRNHPFKSDDAAVNFSRRAVSCIPKGELRIEAYVLLAEILYKRNWKPDKRSSEMEADMARYRKGGQSNMEKYSFYDGEEGPGAKTPWSGDRCLGQMGDREEALAILSYAKRRYAALARIPYRERQEYPRLLKLEN